MKKLTGILLVVLMTGVLAGCWSSACQGPAPMSYKGEG